MNFALSIYRSSLCLFYVRRQVRYHFYMSIITPVCLYSGGLLSNIAEVVQVCSQNYGVQRHVSGGNLCLQHQQIFKHSLHLQGNMVLYELYAFNSSKCRKFQFFSSSFFSKERVKQIFIFVLKLELHPRIFLETYKQP